MIFTTSTIKLQKTVTSPGRPQTEKEIADIVYVQVYAKRINKLIKFKECEGV